MNNPFESIDTRLNAIEILLQKINNDPNQKLPLQAAEKILTVEEAAKLLTLSVPTVYGLISRKELPVMKRSKRCYFLEHELIDYLKKGRKLSNSENSIIVDAYLQSKKTSLK